MAARGVSNVRKFQVLTWKTLKVKMRHYIETTLDLIVPTLLFIILAVLRYQGGDSFSPSLQDAQIYSPEYPFFRVDNGGPFETNSASKFFDLVLSKYIVLCNRFLKILLLISTLKIGRFAPILRRV